MPGDQKRFQVVSSPERESWFEYTPGEPNFRLLITLGFRLLRSPKSFNFGFES
jgi:hypothetical protein